MKSPTAITHDHIENNHCAHGTNSVLIFKYVLCLSLMKTVVLVYCTVRLAVPLTVPDVAVMVTVPGFTPVARP